MILNRCPKYDPSSGIRTIPPEETLKKIIPLLNKSNFGIPEDITNKDNIGIPVFSIDRQKTALGIPKYYNGKGTTIEQAEVSAIMELIERYSAELRSTDEIIYGTYEQACDVMMTIDPADLILPIRVLNQYKYQQIAWTMGFEMIRGCHIWVPACAVYYPYYPNGDLQLFRFHTNGIASGNTIEEAILHALFEDIERDAWSIAEFRNHTNADIVINNKNSVPAQLIEKFNERGVDIHLKDLTSDVGIPTIGASADDKITRDPELLTIGVGTHLNPNIAAIRAITEVAQSRATHKHGMKTNAQLQRSSREMGYDKIKRINSMWFEENPKKINLDDIIDKSTNYVLDDIEVVIGNLIKIGLDKIVTVNLTRPELDIPTVRIIVPGLEVNTMDSERQGRRLYSTYMGYK